MGKGMRAGKKPSGPRQSDMQKQMQQLQAMQAKMDALQAELDEKEVTATAGGGVVSVSVNGKRELTAVEIKPEVIDPEDPETLQDLVLAAANEALRQIEELSRTEMEKITGGAGLPGM
ncbi:MAG: YbaB/EbfC family nucleoid-associated protein [Bacillota bacterium]|nr:YbaB/EbfC family nucleoid-associated protein [Bacillota bacterium]